MSGSEHDLAGATCNPASLLKPAIDGVTTALASDDGHSPDAGIQILATHVGRSTAEVGTLLRNGPTTLGRSRLLDRAGRVQAPDHNCVFGELVSRPGADSGWRLAAELFEVRAL